MPPHAQNPDPKVEVLESGDYYDGNTEDAQRDEIRTVWRCPECQGGLAWLPWQYKRTSYTFMPPVCDTCKDRKLGVTDQRTLDFVREHHPHQTCPCGACLHLRAVA